MPSDLHIKHPVEMLWLLAAELAAKSSFFKLVKKKCA